MAELHGDLDNPKPSKCDEIETYKARLREAEAEEMWAELSHNLCQARTASARVKAIRERLRGVP